VRNSVRGGMFGLKVGGLAGRMDVNTSRREDAD
jgi:hypothetical protein